MNKVSLNEQAQEILRIAEQHGKEGKTYIPTPLFQIITEQPTAQTKRL